MWQDGKALSRSAFVAQLRVALRATGIDDAGFSGHSLRIGAVTAAATAGIPDHTITMLGRWLSYQNAKGKALGRQLLSYFVLFAMFFGYG